MDLAEWVEQQGRGELMRLMRKTGLAYPSILSHAKRESMPLVVASAHRISEAIRESGGDVSAAEILKIPTVSPGQGDEVAA